MAIGFENSYQDLPLLDPKSLHKSCIDRTLPTGWLGKVNMYRCPLGEKPGTGALIMRGDAVAKLDRSKPGKLLFSDGVDTVTFPRIYVTGTECLTPGVADTTTAAFLVSIADFRGVPGIGGPYSPWSGGGVGRYNRRWPMGDYFDDTGATSSAAILGTTYSTSPPVSAISWDDMVSALWTAARDNLSWPNTSPFSASSPYPGLPFTPEGIPHNFDYTWPVVWTPWAALNHALTRLACALKYDPIADTVSIVRLGAADAIATAAMALMSGEDRKLWDDFEEDQSREKEYTQGTYLQVAVAFRVQTRNDTFERHVTSFARGPLYDINYYANPDGVTAVTNDIGDPRIGLNRIYDDSYLPNNSAISPPPTNLQFSFGYSLAAIALLGPRGLERANDYMRKYRNFNRPLNIVYRGIKKEGASILGSTVGEVAWYDRGDGAKTEIRSTQDTLLEDWRPTAESLPTPEYLPSLQTSLGNENDKYNSSQTELTWTATTGTAIANGMFALPLTFIKVPCRGFYEYEFVVWGDPAPLASATSYDLNFAVGLFTNANVYEKFIDSGVTPAAVGGKFVAGIATTPAVPSIVIPLCLVFKGTVRISDNTKMIIGLLGGRTFFTVGNNRVDYRVIARVRPAIVQIFTP